MSAIGIRCNGVKIHILRFSYFGHQKDKRKCHKGDTDQEEQQIHWQIVLAHDKEDLSDKAAGKDHNGDCAHDGRTHP